MRALPVTRGNYCTKRAGFGCQVSSKRGRVFPYRFLIGRSASAHVMFQPEQPEVGGAARSAIDVHTCMRVFSHANTITSHLVILIATTLHKVLQDLEQIIHST